MHEILISGDTVNINNLFTEEVLGLVEKIANLAKKIPRSITLQNGEEVLVTPAIATGAIGKIFGLQVKREIPMNVSHKLHDHVEDILFLDGNILIVVWRQFERVPRPVYVDDPSINPRWKSTREEPLVEWAYTPEEFEQILALEKLLLSSDTSSSQRQHSHPHCG